MLLSGSARVRPWPPHPRFRRTFFALLAPCKRVSVLSNHTTGRKNVATSGWPAIKPSPDRIQAEILLVLHKDGVRKGVQCCGLFPTIHPHTAARDPFLQLFLAQIPVKTPTTFQENTKYKLCIFTASAFKATNLTYHPHHSAPAPRASSLLSPDQVQPQGLCACLVHTSPGPPCCSHLGSKGTLSIRLNTPGLIFHSTLSM